MANPILRITRDPNDRIRDFGNLFCSAGRGGNSRCFTHYMRALSVLMCQANTRPIKNPSLVYDRLPTHSIMRPLAVKRESLTVSC